MSKYYLKDHVTDEMLQVVGFEINKCGNYELCIGETSITILEYDGSKHIRCDTWSEELGCITCNPSHNRIGKILISLGYVEVRNDDALMVKSFKSDSADFVIGRGLMYTIDLKKYPGKTIDMNETICIDGVLGKVTRLERGVKFIGDINPIVGVGLSEIK